MFYGNVSGPNFDGLRVLLHSLRKHDRRRPFVLLTLAPFDGPAAMSLQRVHPLHVMRVSALRSNDSTCLRSFPDNARLSNMFTSFHVFNLTQYSRVLWLETDQIVLQSLDELWGAFDHHRMGDHSMVLKQPRAAAVKTLVGPYSSCGKGRKSSKFNTGVVLVRPSAKVFGFLQNAMHGGRSRYTCTDGSQTLWNEVLRGRIMCIHRTFNCIAHTDLVGKEPSRHCLRGNATMPHVAHFAGGAYKPWAVVSDREQQRRQLSWAYRLWGQTLRSYHRQERLSAAQA